MKAEEWTNRVLLFALGKTTALSRERTNIAEFLRFQRIFFQKNRDLINKPILSNVFFSSYKNRNFWNILWHTIPP